MMKKWLSAGLLLSLTAALIGCGKQNADEINPDDYVKLGEYKDITVDVNYYDFTEEELLKYVDQDLEYYVSSYDLYDYKTIEDKTVVEDGDLVNIDYVGTLDGEAFDGGSAEGAHLEIGSGSFIEGFEEGLIGVNVGESVDLNLTFPEDYNEELGGKDVVFSVIVNSIDEAEAPEYDEEFYKNYTADYGIEDVTNYDELVVYARDSITEAKEEYNESIFEDAIWTKISGEAEISSYPDEMINQKKSDIDAELEAYAADNEVDTETALGYLGYDSESFEQLKQETAESETKKDLICMAIAKAEGITVTDDDVKAKAEEEYEMYGFSSADEMLEQYSNDYMKSNVRYQRIMDVLKGYAKANELETVSMLGDYLE